MTTVRVMDTLIGEEASAKLQKYGPRIIIDLQDGRQIVFWTNDVLRELGIEAPATPDLPPNANNVGIYRGRLDEASTFGAHRCF